MMATLQGPYGTELVGPYGTQLVGLGEEKVPEKFAGLYPWQWMFTGATAALTTTAGYLAYKGHGKETQKAVAISAVGGLLGGLLFALAFGKAA